MIEDHSTFFKSGDMKFGIMSMPYRKKPCLAIYDADSNCYMKVASFNNIDSAAIFMQYVADMLGIERKEE